MMRVMVSLFIFYDFLDPHNPSKMLNAQTKKNGYAGDDFVRASGEMDDFKQTQLFAWEAGVKGSSVHMEAQPTATGLFSSRM